MVAISHRELAIFFQVEFESTKFKKATLLEWFLLGEQALSGKDRFAEAKSRENVQEGLVEVQREFNHVTRRLVRQLDRLYDEMSFAFEERFGPRIRNSTYAPAGEWGVNSINTENQSSFMERFYAFFDFLGNI